MRLKVQITQMRSENRRSTKTGMNGILGIFLGPAMGVLRLNVVSESAGGGGVREQTGAY
jgi:hypothetical protein